MSNSYVWFLQVLVETVLRDYLELYPTDRIEVERDMSRLALMATNRGPKVYTIDLPALGKHFDKCLSEGRLTASGLPLSRPATNRSKIPRLFREIYSRVFGSDGLLVSDVDIQAVRVLRQLFYAAKKFRATCEPLATYKAVEEFFNIEKEMRHASHSWDSDDLGDINDGTVSVCDNTVVDNLRQPDLFGPLDTDLPPPCLDSVQRTMDLVAAEIGGFNPSEWRYKHGPGAVADQRRYLNKFRFPTWPAKLDAVFPMDEFAFANSSFWVDMLQSNDGYMGLSPHEPPSRLIAVPKTMKGPRLICSEPTSHQWCQQALKDFLVSRVQKSILRHCLSFDSQVKSGRAALQASLTDSHATIDLSSASDRLSCWLVERAFRRTPSLLRAFHAARTRWIVNNIDKHLPRFHKLRKFAAQGSAVTFPVQSIIYSSIAIGVLAFCRGLPINISSLNRLAREVRIFGDDIIVPKDVGIQVTECLTYLGFKVNPDKTFLKGNFKESCGVDAFQGHDVTPAYVMRIPFRDRPESLISSIEVCRNFFFKEFKHVSNLIESTVRKAAPFLELPSVPKDSGILGWPSPDGLTILPTVSRFDRNLQVRLYRVHVPYGTRKLVDHQGSTSLLQYYTEKPSPFTKWKAGVGLRSETHLRRRWEPLYELT
jgi:hypothetical protein